MVGSWLVLLIAAAPSSGSPASASQAAGIHQSAIVVDTHVDTTQRFVDEGLDFNTVVPTSEGHLDLSKAKAGNMGGVFFSIWVEPKNHAGRYAHRTLQLIDAVRTQVAKNPKDMTLAVSTQDILQARKSNPQKLATLMGIEGGHSIENDLALLRAFYALGVRYMTLTWSNTNEWADSSGDITEPGVKHHNGLTDFGKQVVREMNRLGMLVDVSHVSDKTFWDVMELTRVPVIASHSSARALCDSPRNLTDDMLKAIAKNGGVAMVNFFPAFLDDDFRKAYVDQKVPRNVALDQLNATNKNADSKVKARDYNRAQSEWVAKIPRPPLSKLIDHIDHMVKMAGIDHVGLGSDFDGIPALPQGIESAADLARVTEGLVARGYTREQIHKILGGNFLRVFKAAELARN